MNNTSSPSRSGADREAPSSWELLGRFALAGLTAVAAAIVSLVIGATFADWLIAHFSTANAHPVPIAFASTAAIGTVIFRAVPSRYLWSGFGDMHHSPDAVVPAAVPVGDGDDEKGGRPSEPETPPAPDETSWLARLGRWQWRLCLAAGALVVVVLVHRQVFSRIGSESIGREGDREWYTFLAWKIGEAIRGGTSPFHLSGIVSPHGFNILLSDGFLPPLFGGVINALVAPFTPADSGAVLSYNLMLMLATGLSFWAGTYLAAQISSQRAVKLIVGLALATAPVVYIRFQGHLSPSFNFPVALVAAEAIHIARRGAQVRWIRLSIFLLIAFGCTAYFFIIAAALVVTAAVWRCVRNRTEVRQVAGRVAVSLAVVGVILLPLFVQRSNFTSAEIAAGSQFESALSYDAEAYNADVAAIALPTFSTAINWPGTEQFERKVVVVSGEGNFSFPGLVLLLLGVGGLVIGRRRELGPVLLCAVLVWIASLGPVADVFGVATLLGPSGVARVHWLPFEFLKNIPVLSSLRAPGRLSLGLPAMLAAGCAFSLDCIFARRQAGTRGLRWRSAILPGAIVLAMVPNVPTFDLSPLAFDQRARAMLASLDDQPGATGRVLPVPSCVGATSGTEAIENLWTNIETVGCQGQYLALPIASEMQDYVTSSDLAALRCWPDYIGYVGTAFPASHRKITPDLIELRERFDVRFLVVDATTVAQCAGLPELILELSRGYRVIPGSERWSAIDLDSPVLISPP